MAYKPIESYGLIGNMRSAALVGADGAIDWMCLPAFDSPSVFAAVLDDDKGGSFVIEPVGDDATSTQMYWPDTNILLTRLRTDDGVAEVTDFMPIRTVAEGETAPDLVRLVHAETGPVRIRVACRPAFDYARRDHKIERVEGGVRFVSEAGRLLLRSSVDLKIEGQTAEAVITLDTEQSAALALSFEDKSERVHEAPAFTVQEAVTLRDRAVAYWRRWIRHCTYHGRWSAEVRRSALALKLLTYEPTGAIIAAPTCSLPERIGGSRNWDYRYTWLRDAGYMVYAFLRIGFTSEAAAFMEWLRQRCFELDPDGVLQPLYGIDGRLEAPEQTLDHLDGYRGSKPVRIGNDAYKQLQLDVAGALMDAAYLHNKYATPLSYAMWRDLKKVIAWIGEAWDEPDDGVWESRAERQHYTFSKLMCWVAMDRGVRLAEKRSFPCDQDNWRRTRDEIFEQIMQRGWSRKRQAFVQRFESEELDAANLLMPLVFFIAPNDERMLSTIEAISTPMVKGGLVEDFLVRRYDARRTADGVGGEEGAFNMCTFWLVEALTRAGRSEPRLLEEAEILFNRMLSCASPLGLYAEQTGRSREALGNYPQGFTHLALISAAYNLDRVLGS